jgi:phosphinothricin acetyltransferase
MTAATVRLAIAADAAALAEIYNHYVRDTVITFEEEPVPASEMARRVAEVQARLPWYVIDEGGAVLGYAYASSWKTRSAYRHSVESTVYLAPAATGRGLGAQLYGALLAQLKRDGLHCVIGGIALPNAASIALHEKCGFRKVAQFHEVGFKFGHWIDVGYWEVLL